MTDTGKCVVCAAGLTPFGRRQGYNYHNCPSCGTLQLVPLPSREELDEAYTEQYATAQHIDDDPELHRIAFAPYHKALMGILRQYGITGRVLDYGAGWGFLCQMLNDNGFTCEGLDLSEKMVEHAQEQRLPVRFGDIEEAEDNRYAALVLCTVFEHLVDHEAWLGHAGRVLQEGGLFVSSQPTARFGYFVGTLIRLGRSGIPLPALHHIFCPPWHTVLFSLAGMQQIAERNGFTLLEIRVAPQGRAVGITGILQRILGAINWLGTSVMGVNWPLLTGHIFVFRKTN